MGYLDSLGVRRIINADATLTRLGGSLMPREVLDAMLDASCCWVDLPDLQRRVGARIAELTHNEACFVTSGAAAGLTLLTAACVAGNDPALIQRLPDVSVPGMKGEVIVHRNQRIGYDYAVRQVGVKLIEIGNATTTHAWELERAITAQTAAVLWFQGWMVRSGDLPLARVIEIATARGVPVIVDAAAQLPPVENLWKFTQMGAAAVVFSGGKELRGPQSSGLVVGRRDLIALLPYLSSPNPHIGRPMKVGKEELVGVLAAVERYLQLDHAARLDYCEETVADWAAALNRVPGVQAVRSWPNEAGQPVPRVHVAFEAARFTSDDVVRALWAGDPAIAVSAAEDNAIYLNPMTLEPGEEAIVLRRMIEVLRGPATIGSA
jgi:D-glucosaminate-6-phosphate ammonia-lyase